MSDKIKYVECEYIESGTFQGGEEDVSIARIKYGEDCVAMSKKQFDSLEYDREAMLSAMRKAYDSFERIEKWAIQVFSKAETKPLTEALDSLEPFLK